MHRLVVPTDFTPFAQEALRFAMAVRRRTGAEVHLLHVETPTAPSPLALETATPEAPTPEGSGATRDAVLAALREQAETAGTTAGDLTLAIRTSYAIAPEVLAYASESGADAIVAGTHGRRGLRRWMLGSVAEEIVRTAPVDVLVAPLREADEASGGVPPPFSARPARRVLVPLDLREGSAALLAHAHHLARELGSERVDLLHVLEPMPYPVRFVDEVVMDLVPTIRDRAAESLRVLAAEEGLEPGGVYVERGRAERTIRRVAEALDSDFLVLSPHEQTRMGRALLGSVAGEVARTARRPVLVARSLAPASDAAASGDERSGTPEPSQASASGEALPS